MHYLRGQISFIKVVCLREICNYLTSACCGKGVQAFFQY